MTAPRISLYHGGMIQIEDRSPVRLVRLAHGKASALDVEFLRGISKTFEKFRNDGAPAVCLTGTGEIFSAGVHLKRLVEGGDEYLREFMPALSIAFRDLFFYPGPMVVACNGHAIAGGGVMLSCGDLRFVAQGKARIGVPELAVGVPFPLVALEIMRFVVPPQHIQNVLFSGTTYDVEEAHRLGLCDAIHEPESLEEVALDAAGKLASYPTDAFRTNKAMLRRPVGQVLAAHGLEDDRRIDDLWASPEVRGAVQDYVAKTLG